MTVAMERMFTLIVVGAALAMTVVFLYDRARHSGASGPTVVAGWQDYNETGIWLGSKESEVVVTEFMDFTCPFCRSLAPVTDSLRQVFPGQVAVVFQHFPLPGRELSFPMAKAAECAYAQGRFEEMYHELFQHELTEPPIRWEEYADAAGVPDLTSFHECMSRPDDTFDRIAAGIDIGTQTGVLGTPTVWVNGRLTNARSVAAFETLSAEMGVQLERPESMGHPVMQD